MLALSVSSDSTCTMSEQNLCLIDPLQASSLSALSAATRSMSNAKPVIESSITHTLRRLSGSLRLRATLSNVPEEPSPDSTSDTPTVAPSPSNQGTMSPSLILPTPSALFTFPSSQNLFLPIPRPPTSRHTYVPSKPLSWLWACHICRRSYPLSVTRRCLEDGHFFCAGFSQVKLRKSEKTVIRRHRACSSEFDYVAWREYGGWKRASATDSMAAGCWSNCDFPSECRTTRNVMEGTVI